MATLDLLTLGMHPGEAQQLSELLRSRQYPMLRKFLLQVEEAALANLVGFSNPSEAYERRGYLLAVRTILSTLEEVLRINPLGENNDTARNTAARDTAEPAAKSIRLNSSGSKSAPY